MASSSTKGEADGEDGDSAITLGLLDALHQNSEVSQRRLSSELGIALGLTNAYLRRCVRKGWIKMKSAPANRYAYYLTPQGFAEKSRLTAGYLSRSLSFYREARNACDDLLGQCAGRGWTRVALYGSGDLAEIALLCAMRHAVRVAAVVDPAATEPQFLGVPMVANLEAAPAVDGVLLTNSTRPQSSYDALAAALPADRILVPSVLRVSPRPGDGGGAR